MGSSKNLFFNLQVSLPGGCKYFRDYLRENKNILGVAQGPMYSTIDS